MEGNNQISLDNNQNNSNNTITKKDQVIIFHLKIS